ncbi:hypothetical protein Baya_1707 [Bagarius yarrelli]|uniref:Uncharacterized protein n=1 Tax=Bagarius yarrelli TaxID=175774 RepID=A0A556TLX5_BAGYA|nr:hypothetical protein Baya_1707 [Bagarius yarrelli]
MHADVLMRVRLFQSLLPAGPEGLHGPDFDPILIRTLNTTVYVQLSQMSTVRLTPPTLETCSSGVIVNKTLTLRRDGEAGAGSTGTSS